MILTVLPSWPLIPERGLSDSEPEDARKKGWERQPPLVAAAVITEAERSPLLGAQIVTKIHFLFWLRENVLQNVLHCAPKWHRCNKKAYPTQSDFERLEVAVEQQLRAALVRPCGDTPMPCLGLRNRRPKRPAELRCEAKRKLTYKRAAELSPSVSLYALRHSWATHALQNGVDALTVAILMGHKDPSMLAKVYQHLALNPSHMLQQARKAAG